MKKKFCASNEIGLEIEYTTLALTSDDGNKYVIYTDYFPSDNELGIRLYVGKLIDEEKFSVEKVDKKLEKKLKDSFVMEIITTGKKIKRIKKK